MATAVSLSILDGQATPVAVTFAPESVNSDVASFVDRTPGVAIGFRRITVSTKFAKGASKVNRAKYSVELPITTVVNGLVTLASVGRVNVEAVIPDTFTDLDRKNLFAFAVNGLNNALIKGAVRDLDPVY